MQPGRSRILLVRHTEVLNPDAILYGRLPRFDLSPAGRAHAEQVAEQLAAWPVEAIYSSPLLRARRVVAAIARHFPDATVHRSSLLHEVGSAWHGTPFADFPAGFNTFDQPRHPADESMEQIRDRMLRFVRRASQRHPGGTVVAVSHGDPITILRVVLLGIPLTIDAIRGSHYASLGSITDVMVDRSTGEITVSIPDEPMPQAAGGR